MAIAGAGFPFSFGFAPNGAVGESVGLRQNEAILVAVLRKIAIDKNLFREIRSSRQCAAMAQKLLRFLRQVHTKWEVSSAVTAVDETSQFGSARELKE
jgi:hypothetical protein